MCCYCHALDIDDEYTIEAFAKAFIPKASLRDSKLRKNYDYTFLSKIYQKSKHFNIKIYKPQ